MTSDEHPHTVVQPGALTALLGELARAPPGAGWAVPALPGEMVARFEVAREIGRGGFGVVYEARDIELGRSVALKAIYAGSSGMAREQRALAEAEAAARLAHPNIVHLYDVGRCDRGAFLVMELLHGESLQGRLSRGSLQIREAVQVALEVARGVAHAHQQGVVHRDLKPANVFLCDDGQVKVLDFGLAHVLGREDVNGGTPEYMAPEQARGEPSDARADVYALGVIMFELLAGRRTKGPEPIPGAPAALARLVARMLAGDPAARPASAVEVKAQLAAIAEVLATRRVVRTSLVVAAVAVATAAAFAWLWQRPFPQGRLLVAMADTANASGDPDLDATGDLLGAALEQSRRVSLMARSRLSNLLEAGGSTPTIIDEAAARQAAHQAGAQVVLVPEAGWDEQRFTVAVRVVGLEPGEQRFVLRESALGKGSVADAIERLSSRLLERLGEAPSDTPGRRVRLADIAPANPEAWRHLEQWRRLRAEGREEEAEAALDRLVALDPENPLAHLELMFRFTNEDLEKAFQHADLARRNLHRVPAKERALVEAMTKFMFGGSQEERMQLLDEVIAGWPEEPRAYEWAGVIMLNRDGAVANMRPYLEKAVEVAQLTPGLRISFLSALGRLDEALAAAQRYATAREDALSYLYLAAVHRWRGETAEALAAGRRSVALDSEPTGATQRWNFVEAGATEELEALRPADARKPHWLALRGRWREALASLDETAPPATAPARARGLFHARRGSFIALRAGDVTAVWREVEAQFRLGFDGLACSTMWLALAGDLEGADRLARTFPAGAAGCARVASLLGTWHHGDREAALRGFAGLYGYGADYHRGRLLVELGRDREAVGAFQAYRRRPDHPLNQQAEPWSAAFYPRSMYLEAAALDRLGQREEALRLLERLHRLWNRADGDAPFVREARALRSRLAAGGAGRAE